MPAKDSLVQYLLDREDIRTLLERYYRAVDTSDEFALRNVFTADATWNFNKGSLMCAGFDEIWRIIGPVGKSPAAMHFMGNHLVALNGDTAKSETYGIAHVVRMVDGWERDGLQGLRYQDFLVRTPAGWRVKARTQLVEWQRGDILKPYAEPENRKLPDGFFTPLGAKPLFGESTASSKDPAIQQLADRLALRDLLVGYYSCIDRYDFAGLRAVFLPDAHLNFHGGVFNDSGIDKIIKFVSGIQACRVTMHFMGNQNITLNGDSATLETYAMAHHLRADGDLERDDVYGLRYQDQAVRTPEGWRVKARIMHVDWLRRSGADRLTHAPTRLF